MDELIQRLNAQGIRYLVIGGQAARLEGVPRFSMDWDFYLPPKDQDNFDRLNELLEGEIDMPVVARGDRGENSIQTYQTRWGIVQFHLGGPGLPPFDEAETRGVIHRNENGTEAKCLSGTDLLSSKEAASRPQDQTDIEFLRAKRDAGLL